MKKLSKIDKLILVGLCIKATTGVLGASLILSEKHPYFALVTLAIGAASNELLGFFKNREYKSVINKNEDEIPD